MPDIPFPDIKRNMEELAFINQWLGGHRITLDGLKYLTRKSNSAKPVHIVEIGCGGGNNLYKIKQWAYRNRVPVLLTGIDINEECIAFARQQPQNENIQFISSDYRNAPLNEPVDIIFSSLFCHHFTDEDLVMQLQWMHRHSNLGFFINDLHRHPLAYHSIKLLTKYFSKSYLVKHDAPLSVRRGFLKEEWANLFQRAQIDDYSCQWKWAFRWLIVCLKK